MDIILAHLLIRLSTLCGCLSVCLSVCHSYFSFARSLHSCYSLESYFNATACLFFTFTYFVTISGEECLRPGLWGTEAVNVPAVLCGNSMATCTQDRRLWIWIMGDRFYIHYKPADVKSKMLKYRLLPQTGVKVLC